MTGLACPCGGTLFRAIEGGNYTEEHYIDTVEEVQWTEDQDIQRMNIEAWECRSCKKPVEGELAEALDAAEDELEWRED